MYSSRGASGILERRSRGEAFRSAEVRPLAGVDTSRYGHYAAFLRDDLQPACDELSFAESASGYAQFRSRFELLAQRHPNASFTIRLDAAGQYADNLLHFLRQLADPSGAASAVLANRDITISCGDPQRNKNYRAALFAAKKSDAVEARACARFAISERHAAGVAPGRHRRGRSVTVTSSTSCCRLAPSDPMRR